MAKSLKELHDDHQRHRLATYFIFLFVVFLGIAVLLIAKGQSTLGSTNMQTNASEDLKPTPAPASCINTLTYVSYKGQKQCPVDSATSAVFGCTNGYVGEVLANGCDKVQMLKLFANQECLYQSTCTSAVPKIEDIMIVKDSACPANQSKTALIKCNDNSKSSGVSTWARVNNNTCQTVSAWRGDARSNDVCQSRKMPWYNPTPTPPYPTPTMYGPTATPGYPTPTPANPSPYPTSMKMSPTPTPGVSPVPVFPTATPTPQSLP